MRVTGRVFASILLGVPLAYFTACSYLDWSLGRAYKTIQVGDNEQRVLDVFGTPTKRTVAGVAFPPIGEGCKMPCAQRLWYENRLLPDITAWSVDVDGNGRVVEKSYWLSP